jgi:hypothetical protein
MTVILNHTHLSLANLDWELSEICLYENNFAFKALHPSSFPCRVITLKVGQGDPDTMPKYFDKIIKFLFLCFILFQQHEGVHFKGSYKGGPITDATVKSVNNMLQPDVVEGLLCLSTLPDNRGTPLNENFHRTLKSRLGKKPRIPMAYKILHKTYI